MALHPEVPLSPFQELLPEQRWFPAAEELRAKDYEKHRPQSFAALATGFTQYQEVAT